LLYQAMTACQKGQDVKDEQWQPYFKFLIQQYQEGIKTGKNVVLSFAVYNLFGDSDLIRKELPGIKFVVIDVTEDLLLSRCLERSKKMLVKAGTTEEEVWKQDYMAEYRERYGEEYTPERYRQMEVDGMKENVYVKNDGADKSVSTINNDDWENHSAVKELNKVVGLEWEDVDSAAIQEVQMKRYEQLNLDGLSEKKQDNAESKSQQLLWLVGAPGAGKTYLGDYLATRGWHHIDGDQGNSSKDPEVQRIWQLLYQAMTACQKGQDVKDEQWQPYFKFLIQQYQEGIKTGKNVVLSFAVYNLFGDSDLIRKELPGIKFVVIDVTEDLLLSRCLERSKKMLVKAGTTEEEVWKQDYMAEYRERYGEEYTPERYRQMEVDGMKENVYVKNDGADKSVSTINNDDWENHSAVKELNKVVGLEWEDVDSAAIQEVQMKRYEQLNLDGLSEKKAEGGGEGEGGGNDESKIE